MKMEMFGFDRDDESVTGETQKINLISNLLPYRIRHAAVELFLQAHKKSNADHMTTPERPLYYLVQALCLLVMSQVTLDEDK